MRATNLAMAVILLAAALAAGSAAAAPVIVATIDGEPLDAADTFPVRGVRAELQVVVIGRPSLLAAVGVRVADTWAAPSRALEGVGGSVGLVRAYEYRAYGDESSRVK